MAAPDATPFPILFVTQVPKPDDFTTITSTFGNHSGQIDSVPRGGDLWIRYPDGSLKNLTRTAGYGMDGLQGANAIAVREPSRALERHEGAVQHGHRRAASSTSGIRTTGRSTRSPGLGKNDTPVIRKIPNQPADFNNISPIYGTDDRILFTSDRPRNGARHLYPQLDEYEEAADRHRALETRPRRPASCASSITPRPASSRRRSTASAA